jgi:class 3 adenylate cyclase
MAFFGFPEAHDNDAERAVRAALAMLEAIAKLNESPAHPQLAARAGIDSGAVVAGAGTGPEAISARALTLPDGKRPRCYCRQDPSRTHRNSWRDTRA